MSTSDLPAPIVLCPVDFSPASEVAVRVAAEEAERRDAQLDLLHVWTPQPAFLTDSMGAAVEVPPPLDELREQLHAVQVPLPPDRVRRHVAVGSAVATIVDMSEDLHAELIVMGTHARHGLARWILGSVVEPVLRMAPCPVLVVRGPHRAATASPPSNSPSNSPSNGS